MLLWPSWRSLHTERSHLSARSEFEDLSSYLKSPSGIEAKITALVATDVVIAEAVTSINGIERSADDASPQRLVEDNTPAHQREMVIDKATHESSSRSEPTVIVEMYSSRRTAHTRPRSTSQQSYHHLAPLTTRLPSLPLTFSASLALEDGKVEADHQDHFMAMTVVSMGQCQQDLEIEYQPSVLPSSSPQNAEMTEAIDLTIRRDTATTTVSMQNCQHDLKTYGQPSSTPSSPALAPALAEALKTVVLTAHHDSNVELVQPEPFSAAQEAPEPTSSPTNVASAAKVTIGGDLESDDAMDIDPCPSSSPPVPSSSSSSRTTSGKRRREESQARSSKIVRVLRKPFVSPIRPTSAVEETPPIFSSSPPSSPPENSQQPKPEPTLRITTRRLAKPFKPPQAATIVSVTANLRSLEDRVRLLRQAVRYHTRPDEDARLEELVVKWRSAGREITERLFDRIPKPDGNEGCVGWQGYNPLPLDRPCEVVMATSNDENSHDTSDIEMETEKAAWSFGTMMKQMGVDPEVLGWDETEEDWHD